MPVTADAHDTFSALLTALVRTESRDIRLFGTIDALFSFPFLGKKSVALGFDVTNVFKGFNGLHDTTFLSLTSKTMDEVNKKLTLTVKVNIKSPSTLSLKLGDIFFKTSGPDGPIGITTLQNVDLNHGDNPLTAIVVIDLSLAGAAKFVSGLDKADATVTLTGTGSSPANPVTLAAVQSLEINVVIPQTFTPKTV